VLAGLGVLQDCPVPDGPGTLAADLDALSVVAVLSRWRGAGWIRTINPPQ
jgi:hypothetical protein